MSKISPPSSLSTASWSHHLTSCPSSRSTSSTNIFTSPSTTLANTLPYSDPRFWASRRFLQKPLPLSGSDRRFSASHFLLSSRSRLSKSRIASPCSEPLSISEPLFADPDHPVGEPNFANTTSTEYSAPGQRHTNNYSGPSQVNAFFPLLLLRCWPSSILRETHASNTPTRQKTPSTHRIQASTWIRSTSPNQWPTSILCPSLTLKTRPCSHPRHHSQ